MIQTSGELPHALGMDVLTSSKDSTTQSKLQISLYPYQSIHDIFHRASTNNPNMHAGTGEDPELPKQSCAQRTQLPRLQTTLPSDQNGMEETQRRLIKGTGQRH